MPFSKLNTIISLELILNTNPSIELPPIYIYQVFMQSTTGGIDHLYHYVFGVSITVTLGYLFSPKATSSNHDQDD